MSDDPITSIPSSVPTFPIVRWESVTSCTSSSVMTALPVCAFGDRSGVRPWPTPAQAKVIGSAGVPDRAMTTGAVSTTGAVAMIATVCPGSTTLAASWAVQYGTARVPGPVLSHDPPMSTYSVVAELAAAPPMLPAARAEGMAATPIMRTAAATPANPPESRTRRRLKTKSQNISQQFLPAGRLLRKRAHPPMRPNAHLGSLARPTRHSGHQASVRDGGRRQG